MTTAPHIPAGLTPQPPCTILEVAGTFTEQWCVYEHHLHDPTGGEPELIYINATPLRSVYSLIDGRKNNEWVKRVQPGAHLYVTVRWTGSQTDCLREASRLLRSMPVRPPCNARGFDMSGLSRRIIDSNGNQYANQLECATTLNLNQGNLSRHLNHGTPQRVGGMTFRYADATQDPDQ